MRPVPGTAKINSEKRQRGRISNRALVIGAVIGLAIALGVSYAMFRVGLRLNLGRFFAIVGSLLMVVAAGPINQLRSMITGWFVIKTEEIQP